MKLSYLDINPTAILSLDELLIVRRAVIYNRISLASELRDRLERNSIVAGDTARELVRAYRAECILNREYFPAADESEAR